MKYQHEDVIKNLNLKCEDIVDLQKKLEYSGMTV
jgi:hypothetical protein